MQKSYHKKFSVKGFTKRFRFFVLLLSVTFLSVSAVANVYNVTTTTDFVYTAINNATGAITVGSGVGQVTLRSAIQAADALGGTHTINVPAGTYTITRKQIVFGNTAQNITIDGAGAATTIINMSTNVTERDRIFFINPTGLTNSPVITITDLKFQNAYLTNDPYGGAAICSGGGVAEALTVNNCIFENNIVPFDSLGGGAICTQVRGNLSIDNCTFINNVSRDANGGAVLFFIYNSVLGNGQGNFSCTNSTFTGNIVNRPGVGSSNGGAIAYGGPGGSVFFSATITKNMFLNNTADGYGGAISANNGPALNVNQIHFNRLVNNTSLTDATTSGLHVAGSSGNVNAENNWWGCNTGPSVAGACDRAAVIGGVPANLDADPWLQLKTTASPNPICNTPAGLGNITTVTTSFLTNSAGAPVALSDISLLIGRPVTWSTGAAPVLGTLSAQQVTIQTNGTATATFTANTTGGNATVNTQVDNIPITDPTARATIVVNTIPVVTVDPINFTSCVGGTATFSATITGTPTPTYQWRIGTTVLTNGLQTSGSTISGATTTTLTITNVQPGDELTTYNIRATNHCGEDISAYATLTVNSVTGGTVGSDQTICFGGDPAAFTESVASTGDGVLSYQWQSSTTGCGGAFSNIGGATSATYDAPAGLALTTTYRRVTTSTLNAVPCTALSNCITVTINNVAGGTVAANQTVCSGGDPAAFTQTVASTGSGALTYQWQSSTTGCGGVFSDIGGATNMTYDPPAGLLVTTTYRRVTTSTLTGVPCTANSNCITVTLNDVTGGTIAADQVICSGGDPALLTEAAPSLGSGALTYQWQSSTTGCGGAFSNIGGATATTYDPPAGLTVTTTYRRVTTSTLTGVPCTANSNCITVTINNVTGGTVGSDQTICSGGDPAPFTESVASTGDGGLSYQWQSSTTGCGGSFSNILGATSATYDAPTGLLVTTNYRRVTTSTLNGVLCTANSNCITVTVRIVTGGTVAASQTICSGSDPAAFTESLASTGDGVLSYQWQSSTTDCSTGFSDIGGATATTYDAPAELTVTTYYRRVTTSTFNGLACTANSNCLTVTIAATPGITCPTNTSTPACQTQTAVNTAFTAWLATASGTGGVGGVLTNNNTGAPPACGGATTVTFTYTNTCTPLTTTCQATFTVTAPDAVVLNCPENISVSGNQTQAAVNGAFAAWLATASGTGGCNGIITNNNSGAPPAAGGSTTVTFTYTSSCAPLTTTCQATFTVLPPGPLNCPISTTAAACQTQAAINSQFASWLATASGIGGCNGVLTNDNTGAPSACGGSTTVTFTYTSTCEPFTLTCSATFTVAAPPVVSLTCPVTTSTAACLTQAQVNSAFSGWLATASGTGGCNGVLTNNNTGAPSACGGATTVIFTYTSTCAPLTTTCAATFTVPAPPVVSLTCPTNTSTANGQTQAAVNTAFSEWLATASGTGGCNGVLTNNNTGAPPAGGGSTTVTFTYTSTCAPLTTTCQASFTVLSPNGLTCPVSTTVAACQTQAAVNNAFAAWLATGSASGGCDGVLTNDNTGAPSACGGSTTVTFTYTSTCEPFTTTCSATFTVNAPSVISLTCPVSTSTAACLTQAQVNTAFSAWLATASGTGGCNGVLTNNNTGAPSACGGSTTVTFTYTSTCAPLTTTCQATFTVPAPPIVSLTCPVNTSTAACLTQAQVNIAFSAWLATASGTGGCNGILTNNNTGAPSACGGATTVTFTYTTTCAPLTTTCQATFTVPNPPTISLTCPVNISTSACLTQAQVNTAFSAWLATASGTGGCNGILTNNNTGAPSACGGATTVIFTYTSSCAPLTTTCQATFTVPNPPTISLTCPVNISTSDCLTQAQVNTAFSAWLSTASGTGGCSGVLTNNNTGAPPACGGATSVTFTYTSSCAPFTTTCQATFTVLTSPVVSITCPLDISTSSCLSQAQANTAFSAWLATASGSGGCNGVLTNNNTGAPAACVGGSTTVTFTYTSSCAPFTTTCQATFTVPVPAAPVITCPVNTTTAPCQSQRTVDIAFNNWLATASAGGCAILTNNNSGAPPACGGSTTVTFTATNTCTGATTTCQASFTVPPDVIPPSITNESANPVTLWPPNHKMRDVTINYAATDCGAFTTSLSVTSNEPINGTGDGDTAPDWEIVDNHHVKLRAEKAGNGDGRIYTITITATDACGNSSSKNVTVIVAHNITAPISGKSFKVGSTVSFSGTFWDQPGNKHTGKWLIDGASVNATITEPVGNQNGKSTGSYKFNTPGVYKLQMNITDQNGVTSYANTQGDLDAIVIIYDPNGGYTNGGGWYPSPAGALISDPTSTGKASYGFSMNYYKNATKPKGETQFGFMVGDFEYNALNFDYLVISNSFAQFKGTGKIIGGQSGVNFIMSVIDGQLDGTGIDKVRMKIYNKNNGRVYYDNMPGASDAALPVQPVGTDSYVMIGGTNNNNPNTKINSEVAPENKGLELAAYPNPSSSNYTIQVSGGNAKEKILLQVYDVSGKIIETRNNVNAGSLITLGDKYRPGSYLVRVIQGNDHKEIKLVKLSD